MKRQLLILSFFALLIVSPVRLHFWKVGDGIKPEHFALSEDYDPIISESADTMFLGNPDDCVNYAEDKIKIADCLTQADYWQSGDKWKVKEAISGDLNRDGKNELILVVWRPFKPWPIDSFLPHGGRISTFHDKKGLSCHLILVGWDGDEYRELWAGSSLIDPVFDISAVDLDQDGNQELVAIEGKYDSTNRTGNLTVWDWSGFGFRLRDRKEGYFSDYGIVLADQNVMIVSN